MTTETEKAGIHYRRARTHYTRTGWSAVCGETSLSREREQDTLTRVIPETTCISCLNGMLTDAQHLAAAIDRQYDKVMLASRDRNQPS